MTRLVFLGSDTFSVLPLQAIFDHAPQLGVEVVGVVTQPDRPAGRGRRLTPNIVKRLATHLSLPVIDPERLRQPAAVDTVLGWCPDLLVVVAYGQLLPDSLFGFPRNGCLNLHPSLLPRHRGPSPVAATILAGDRITGTTMMVVTSRMDAGPIVTQTEIPVPENATSWELETALSGLSAELLLAELPRWLAGNQSAVEQDESDATYSRKLTKADGRLDWNQAAGMLARQVRAFNAWPIAFSYWEDRRIQFLRAHAVAGNAEPGQVVGLHDGALTIGTGDSLLAVDQLRLGGSQSLPAPDVVRGNRALLDARLV